MRELVDADSVTVLAVSIGGDASQQHEIVSRDIHLATAAESVGTRSVENRIARR